MADEQRCQIVVFSTLFPNMAQPQAGLFIRERMFRVGKRLPVTVVAPAPWFPFQFLLRLWRPHFRPAVPAREVQDGVEVLHPRFLSFPGFFKGLDGVLLALGCLVTLYRLKRANRLDVIDAHFAYPDGYAAGLLGRWLGVPVTITLRGTEVRHAANPVLRKYVVRALDNAAMVFAVSDSLRKLALQMGVPADRAMVVGNGVDSGRFHRVPKDEARAALGLPPGAPVLISVGALTERKGFHRVIDLLPELRKRWPDLVYLIVGGASAEGDWRAQLQERARGLAVHDAVRFLGTVEPDRLSIPLSAADLFVLATRNEGWANVFLEAMACGLPVVTTDVGGNREVVVDEHLGFVVPFDDAKALASAISRALTTEWDRARIRRYAEENDWDSRVDVLCGEFERVIARNVDAGACVAGAISRTR